MDGMRELYKHVRNGREEWSITPTPAYRAVEIFIFFAIVMLLAQLLQWAFEYISGWSERVIVSALGL